MKLSEKIYTCRKKAGLSQEALAEKLGVSRQAVSKWETDEAIPELSKIPMMAKIFDVTTDWLLFDNENFEENNEKISQYFAEMRKLFIDIAAKKLDNVDIVHLSMGMSGDYKAAIKYGATIIRIGSGLFGYRKYNN